jgi:hypothetical protein
MVVESGHPLEVAQGLITSLCRLRCASIGLTNDLAWPILTVDSRKKPAYPNTIKCGLETGISAEGNGLCVHSLRATAATNALSHDSDIAKVQE